MANKFRTSLNALQSILAATEEFQDWTGADDATEAKTHIGFVYRDFSASLMPFAMVTAGDGFGTEMDSMSAGASFHPTPVGEMELRFEAEPGSGTTEVSANAFMDHVFACIEEMEELSGSGTYLLIKRMNPVTPVPEIFKVTKGNSGTYYGWTWRIAP